MTDEKTLPIDSENPSEAMTAEDVVVATGGTVKGDTSYVLLSRRDPNGDDWIDLGRFDARDPESAIKSYVEKTGGAETGTFVAIAQKFWRPVTPAVEVVTTKTVTLKAAS